MELSAWENFDNVLFCQQNSPLHARQPRVPGGRGTATNQLKSLHKSLLKGVSDPEKIIFSLLFSLFSGKTESISGAFVRHRTGRR